MPKARLIYDGDGDYIEKDRRILQLKQEIQDKVDAIPGVVDDLTGTSSIDALSANMGRVLQEQINELSALGHFLSGWNASTGLPTTNPRVDPYYYKTGDYYRVTAIGETNYKPHGGTYNQGVASTAVELDDVNIGDWYMYDGGVRILIKQGGSGGGGAYFKTQAEYDALPTSKESDNNLYIIVDNHNEPVTITFTALPEGWGTFNVNSITARQGDIITIDNNLLTIGSQTIIAIPSSGYSFKERICDGASLPVVVSDNMDIVAIFMSEV